ncbi:MAG: hypothetical protein LAO56_00980 [Acidobacteriia bacterium]|nr:hypothetical protein [Terriglobia bacterium]
MRQYLDSLVEWSGSREGWRRPISRPAVVAWLAFYVVFLIYAFSKHGGYLFIDSANLVVHEGGHLLFGWFGPTLGLWGGTILQWLVPLLLAAYFFRERQPAAFVFCMFFFFENWLYTAIYMADARAMALPLVTTGDSDYVEHDWNTIFSSLGLLPYDTRIAAIVRSMGWGGMLACTAWLGARLTKIEVSDDGKHVESGTSARPGAQGSF